RKLLKLFPNPASEFIAFNEEIELAEIFDSQGRCVIQKQNVGNGEKLDVLNLSKGLYSCKLSDKKGKITTLKFSKL
ncbi:MAG: T9SS type A sorting domain-containing protein, partial [Flavobacteriia bacterium]